MEDNKVSEDVRQATVVAKTHPWLRYWARFIDYGLAGFFVGIVAGIIYPALLKVNNIVLGMIIIFFWIFIEAFCLSVWATTPGKSLLQTFIFDTQGNKLRFTPALKRSFSVWLIGMGAGLPIVSFITPLVGYYQLKTSGVTVWDKNGQFTAVHRKIGAVRITILCLLFAGFLFLIFLGVAAKTKGMKY